MAPPAPSLAIVIPAYNAARHLPRVVPAARRAAGDGEVVVVDPGSSDATAQVAAELGARVVRLPERAGPARARNLGTEAVDAEVVLFIDSDCVPHPDVGERVRAAFAAEPRLVSLTGSYDDAPPHKGFFSQYMNLRHHHTHQLARRDGAIFWAGCGAVRRRPFLDAGGFDAERFPRPQIEDIELGLRLAQRGPMRLDPDLQVTHLKAWTGRSVVVTDVRCRAVPWTRLILARGELPRDLNLRPSQRLAAALAPLALLAAAAVPAAAVLAATFPGSAAAGIVLALAVPPLAASLALNRGLVACFRRRRGTLFALGGWLFHQVHLFYSAATFALCSLRYRLGSKPA